MSLIYLALSVLQTKMQIFGSLPHFTPFFAPHSPAGLKTKGNAAGSEHC
jgi:hypothetical protein